MSSSAIWNPIDQQKNSQMQLNPVQLPKPKLKDTKDAVKRTQSEYFASTMVITYSINVVQ